MNAQTYMTPLPRRKRRHFFLFLVLLFVCVIPFLYLHASGYRFSWREQLNFIPTGGLFIAAEQTGVEIYIDNELVRETRVFRKAFYAQNIDPGTHRVHVQKEGFHTWVKELPVYPHLVTEVQTFNFPLVPQMRPVTRYETQQGLSVVMTKNFEETLIAQASSTETVFATSSIATSTYVRNQEFTDLLRVFEIVEATSTPARHGVVDRVETVLSTVGGSGTTTVMSEIPATTTKEYNNVRLFERDGELYAGWVGYREGMPYYYCAKDFELLPKIEEAATQVDAAVGKLLPTPRVDDAEVDALLNPPVQQVPEGEECVPEIKMDRKGQKIAHFDFFPGSTDLVMLVLEDGIYAVEIDNRSWQNMQPILRGTGLTARVYNGHVVVYDGTMFYEMIYEE